MILPTDQSYWTVFYVIKYLDCFSRAYMLYLGDNYSLSNFLLHFLNNNFQKVPNSSGSFSVIFNIATIFLLSSTQWLLNKLFCVAS